LARAIQPDMILCDFHLPGKNGLDAIRHIKAIEALKHTPILMETADINQVEEALQLGVNDYLIKPLRKNMLLSKVQQYLTDS
jgi:CheY-like chemotaxis protein